MKDWFGKRGIPYKIGFGVIGGALVLMILGVGLPLYFFSSASTGSRILEIANRIEVLLLDSQRLEKDFMLRDLADPGFHETGETINLSKHKSTWTALRKEIVELASVLPDAKKQTASELLRLSDQYSENFHKMVASYREREDKEAALGTAWQKITEGLEGASFAKGGDSFLNLLLTLQRDEKNYVVGRQESDIDAVNADIEKMKKLGASGGYGSAKLGEAIRQYEAAFKSHVVVNRKIGLSEYMGFQADMRDAVHAIIPLVSDLQSSAALESKTATRDLNAIFYLSVMIAVGVCTAIAYTLYKKKSVARPTAPDHDAGKDTLKPEIAAPLPDIKLDSVSSPELAPPLFAMGTALEAGNGTEMMREIP